MTLIAVASPAKFPALAQMYAFGTVDELKSWAQKREGEVWYFVQAKGTVIAAVKEA